MGYFILFSQPWLMSSSVSRGEVPQLTNSSTAAWTIASSRDCASNSPSPPPRGNTSLICPKTAWERTFKPLLRSLQSCRKNAIEPTTIRHRVSIRLTRSWSSSTARSAVRRFQKANATRRKTFAHPPPLSSTVGHEAHHRQQGLFVLVAARLARVQAIGPAVRGGRRAALRRRLGQAPRGRRVRAVLGQGADPVGRRRGGVGQPGDRRISRRQGRPRPVLARRTTPRARWRGRWRRKCIRASPRCAASTA